jgi:hypothetical protein
MITFQVRLNGVLVTHAGAAAASVLSTILMATGKLGPGSTGTERAPESAEVELRVGGMTAPLHGEPQMVSWLVRDVAVGDEISVHITESTAADEPQAREPAAVREIEERAFFESARANYLRLRPKYEPGAL